MNDRIFLVKVRIDTAWMSEFGRVVAPHAVYYKEIFEVREAVRLLLEEMKRGGA